MRKIVCIYCFYVLLTQFLTGQYQSFAQSGNEKLHVEILQVQFSEKKSLLIEFKVTNMSKETILLDTQPFYLVVNGSKGFDHCVLSDGNKFVNYIILKEKGKVSMWNLGGTSKLQYYDQKMPEERLIKPNESICQKLEINRELYCDFMDPVEWEISVWQSWDLLNEGTNNVNARRDKSNQPCFSIPVVKNYIAFLSEGKEKRKNISAKRRLRNHLSESKFFTIFPLQTRGGNH